jgi:hypothetical protein
MHMRLWAAAHVKGGRQPLRGIVQARPDSTSVADDEGVDDVDGDGEQDPEER